MTITVDALAKRARTQATYTTRAGILANDWQVLADTGHQLYRVLGHRAGGLVYDPYWRTTSGSYVSTGSAGARLDARSVWSRPTRKVRPPGGGTLIYMMQLQVYGADFELEVVLKDDDGSAIETDTVSSSGAALATEVQSYDPSSPSTLDLLTYDLRARIVDTKARIWQIAIDEYVLESDAQIPRSFP